jgi:spore coat protein CotH
LAVVTRLAGAGTTIWEDSAMHRRVVWLTSLTLVLVGVPAQFAQSDFSVKLFEGKLRPKFRIQLDDDNLAKLRNNDREYVRATIDVGDAQYAEVGFHLKGAVGSYRGFDDKPAMTLKFDKFRKGQKFHGLDKLHLNNSVQDLSFLSEVLCAELFLAANVPTARGAHAVVELQGKPRGLYVLKEGYDTAFLKRHFGDSKGNLYDGGFLTDIDGNIKKSGGANADDRADLQALLAACREPDRARRVERLDKLLDLDRFISMMAVEVMTWHWDGYGMKHNNYRIYHDPKSDKMVFLPHGMDQMFYEPNGGIQPPMHGLVARALFEVPELRRRYYHRLGELSSRHFTVEKMAKRIDELRERVQPMAEEVSPRLGRQFEQQANHLKARVRARAEFVDKQIKAKLEQMGN